jgi:hypothetical protein
VAAEEGGRGERGMTTKMRRVFRTVRKECDGKGKSALPVLASDAAPAALAPKRESAATGMQ